MTTEVLEYITEVVRTTLWCLYRFFCCCCPLWTDSSIFILRKRAAWTFIKTTTFVFHGRKNVYGFGANLKDLMINLEENIPLKICYCKSSKLWPIWWLFSIWILCCVSSDCRPQEHQPTNNPNTSKLAQKFGSSDVCPRCSKAVYAAEKVIGAGNVSQKQKRQEEMLSWCTKIN